VGVWERSPQPPETRGLGAEPPAFGDFFQFFNENNTFIDIFRLGIQKTVNDLAIKPFFLATKFIMKNADSRILQTFLIISRDLSFLRKFLSF